MTKLQLTKNTYKHIVWFASIVNEAGQFFVRGKKNSVFFIVSIEE